MESTVTKKKQIVKEDIEEALGAKLVVHNDDHNTFDWVIDSLMDICEHSVEQAEQSAIIIHYKGKHAVKHGSKNRLLPLRRNLAERGLNATIDE